jgi:hypothetical protein
VPHPDGQRGVPRGAGQAPLPVHVTSQAQESRQSTPTAHAPCDAQLTSQGPSPQVTPSRQVDSPLQPTVQLLAAPQSTLPHAMSVRHWTLHGPEPQVVARQLSRPRHAS